MNVATRNDPTIVHTNGAWEIRFGNLIFGTMIGLLPLYYAMELDLLLDLSPHTTDARPA